MSHTPSWPQRGGHFPVCGVRTHMCRIALPCCLTLPPPRVTTCIPPSVPSAGGRAAEQQDTFKRQPAGRLCCRARALHAAAPTSLHLRASSIWPNDETETVVLACPQWPILPPHTAFHPFRHPPTPIPTLPPTSSHASSAPSPLFLPNLPP